MYDAAEAVWKALADPTRRKILDLLRDGPRTTNRVTAAFPVSRFAIMKHLRILERAGLVLVERRGRERWNHLNAVPLRRIYERWISGYADQWAGSLLRLQRHVERGSARKGRQAR
jgi:DNA-binding transcriptional ArsR family regulator